MSLFLELAKSLLPNSLTDSIITRTSQALFTGEQNLSPHGALHNSVNRPLQPSKCPNRPITSSAALSLPMLTTSVHFLVAHMNAIFALSGFLGEEEKGTTVFGGW